MSIFIQANDYVIVRLNVTQFPDRFSIDGGQTFVNATPSLDPANATFGDWEWDNINKEIKFIGKLRENRMIVFRAPLLTKKKKKSAHTCFVWNTNYNQASDKSAFHSNETSKDKFSII